MPQVLIEIAYPNRPAESRHLEAGRYLVGREGGHIPIADPEVSGRHGELRIDEQGMVMYADLGSTNGSYTPEGVRVFEPVRLQPGDIVQVGTSSIIVRAIDPTQSPSVRRTPASPTQAVTGDAAPRDSDAALRDSSDAMVTGLAAAGSTTPGAAPLTLGQPRLPPLPKTPNGSFTQMAAAPLPGAPPPTPPANSVAPRIAPPPPPLSAPRGPRFPLPPAPRVGAAYRNSPPPPPAPDAHIRPAAKGHNGIAPGNGAGRRHAHAVPFPPPKPGRDSEPKENFVAGIRRRLQGTFDIPGPHQQPLAKLIAVLCVPLGFLRRGPADHERATLPYQPKRPPRSLLDSSKKPQNHSSGSP